MKTFWKIIDGNKTIICWSIPVILDQAVKYNIIDNTKFIQFIVGLFTVLGGGALYHHAKKGYFSKNKGN